jgi:hypothetical protein
MAKHNPDEYEFTWSPTTAAMMNAAEVEKDRNAPHFSSHYNQTPDPAWFLVAIVGMRGSAPGRSRPKSSR